MSEQFFISVPEAGRRLFGVGKGQSYLYAERGLIPTVRVGRRVFVPVAALEEVAVELSDAARTTATGKREEVTSGTHR